VARSCCCAAAERKSLRGQQRADAGVADEEFVGALSVGLCACSIRIVLEC
jgi:hypothetical protein